MSGPAPVGERQVTQLTLHASPRPIVLAVVRCAEGSYGFRLDCSPSSLLSDRNIAALRGTLTEALGIAFEAELEERRNRAGATAATPRAGIRT